MSFFKNRGIKISGITSVVPANRVTVESFSAVFGEGCDRGGTALRPAGGHGARFFP